MPGPGLSPLQELPHHTSSVPSGGGCSVVVISTKSGGSLLQLCRLLAVWSGASY